MIFKKKTTIVPRPSWTDLDKALKIILINLENLKEANFECDLGGMCECE